LIRNHSIQHQQFRKGEFTMPQKRHFQVIRTDANGFETTTYVETHSPKDFLGDAVYDAPAKPGKVYNIKSNSCLMSGETIRYNKISKAAYDAIVEVIPEKSPLEDGAVWGDELEKIDAELAAVESRVSAVEEATQASEPEQPPCHTPIYMRYAFGADSVYTSDDDESDLGLVALGFGVYLDQNEFDALKEKAEANAYVVILKSPEGGEELQNATASVKQAPAVAPLIPRTGRKSGKGVYGVITKQRDTIARLERKLEQKQALIDNARIREQELRIQFGG
jgi:hypothetical protein